MRESAPISTDALDDEHDAGACQRCGSWDLRMTAGEYALLYCTVCGTTFEEDDQDAMPRRQVKTKLRLTDT